MVLTKVSKSETEVRGWKPPRNFTGARGKVRIESKEL